MINQNFERLEGDYLFREIAVRTENYTRKSGKSVISLGIGDVTQPLSGVVVDAAKYAADEMSRQGSFRGYGDYDGYEFLRRAVCRYYRSRVKIEPDEVFISDGAKSDLYNLTDLFKGRALVPDPVYPVYRDSNVIAGNEVVYSRGNADNGFLPAPEPGVKVDFIYICSPSNPCGEAYDYDGLKAWVDYALETNAFIIYDAAYESYVTGRKPRSVFEIDGAERCAVEVNSLSKSAGFTGVRCGWTIIKNPRLKHLWLRRQSTAFNGVGYIVSRMAEAALSEEGVRDFKAKVEGYLANARLIRGTLTALGYRCWGGVDSPYVWADCGNSRKFFDLLLGKGLVTTPGTGFGYMGEGYARFTGFAGAENTMKACEILRKL